MDADIFFATPVIWSPDYSDEEMYFQIEQMTRRSIATRDFLSDEMTCSDYEMLLETNGMDIDEARLYWGIASNRL